MAARTGAGLVAVGDGAPGGPRDTVRPSLEAARRRQPSETWLHEAVVDQTGA